MYYLHSYGIVHRDLKLENVMMTSDHDTNSVPKLVDFGLAGIKGPKAKFKDAVGTVSYAAPEVLKGQSYDKSIDVWSLGIIIYVLLIGYLPFDSEDKQVIIEKTINDDPPFKDKKWKAISPSAIELIKAMIQKKKTNRITLE